MSFLKKVFSRVKPVKGDETVFTSPKDVSFFLKKVFSRVKLVKGIESVFTSPNDVTFLKKAFQICNKIRMIVM